VIQQTSWQNPRIVLLLSLVFLCGAVSGALMFRLAFAPPSSAKVGPYWEKGGREISLQRFKKELNLSQSQAEEIESVLDDFVMYYQMLQSQMEEVRGNGKSRIVQALNPEQRQKFDRMLDEMQSKSLR
jgi:uncharacterized membrane protein